MKTRNLILAGFTALSGLMAAQVPTSGLMYNWAFDGNLDDSEPAGHHGTWQGTDPPNYVDDRCGNPGNALHFDGISDYVFVSAVGPANDDARSISFWMRTDNTTAGGQSVVRGIFNYGLYTQNVTGSRWEICHNYGCEGVGVDISYEYFTNKSLCVNDGRWHHIVVTQDKSAPLHDVRMYVDGILLPAPSVEPSYNPPGMPNCSPTSNTGLNATDVNPPNVAFKSITIGSVLGSLLPSMTPGVPGRFYDGDLDDVYLYNRVLNSVEVAQLFAEKCEIIPCITCNKDSLDNGDEGHRQADIKTIKNQQQQIEELKVQVQVLSQENSENNNSKANTAVQLSHKNVISLEQNVPNPFSESTVIKYNVPENFKHAQVTFLSDKGFVIKTVEITQKGNGSITVFAEELREGIYAYNLIIDGITVESKRMIKK